MGNVNKAKQIADTLTNEQIVYLHIASDIWGASEAMSNVYIEDIEATGGVFDDDNTLGLVYVDGEFDNAHVNEVISKWKNLHDNDGEMIEMKYGDHPLRLRTFTFIGDNWFGSIPTFELTREQAEELSTIISAF